MYVVKDYDERKAEFLDTAMRLFMSHGYEQTSVNAIIEAVGVSKGAFYHYFKTKEDLVDELAARAAAQALELVAPLVDDESMDAVEKLNEMFWRTNSMKAANREVILTIAQVFYSDGNILLRERLSSRSIDTIAPIFAAIVEQGNREGTMSVRHPEQTARFALRIGSDVVSETVQLFATGQTDEESVRKIVEVMEVYTESMERILGVEPGRLQLVDESMMKLLRGA